MASPRKRWFRVADSILREPLTVEQRGILVGLMAWLNSRWARDGLTPAEATRATLTPGALAEVTGRTQLVHARTALRALGQRVSIAVRDDGAFTEISWPKFAEFQRYSSEPGVAEETQASHVVPPPRPASRDTRTEEKKKTGRPSASLPSWAVNLSRLLIEKLEPVPGARISRGAEARWAREIARMPAEIPELRANGKDPAEHIEAAIRWALGPENLGRDFEVEIRCGRTLREKWPKLVAAARRAKGSKQAKQEEFNEWVTQQTSGLA